MGNSRATWIGFLAMTFAVVGLVGLFASFAAPLPLERALAREQAMDDFQAAVHGRDEAAIEALRPRLDESAAALLPLGGDMDQRIAAERVAMRARQLHEADAVAARLHWMIAIVTVMAAAFGAALLHLSQGGR